MFLRTNLRMNKPFNYLTKYVISMANLRHNHKAINKMYIIQVANLPFGSRICIAGLENKLSSRAKIPWDRKIGMPNIYPNTPEIPAEKSNVSLKTCIELS
jgi:hypothetical protein